MKDLNFKRQHIRYCFMYEFWKSSIIIEHLKKYICALYKDAVNVRACQLWFKRLKMEIDLYPTILSTEDDPLWKKNIWKLLWNKAFFSERLLMAKITYYYCYDDRHHLHCRFSSYSPSAFFFPFFFSLEKYLLLNC